MKSDREIIEAVIAGETELYREIIHRYKHQVAASIAGMLGAENDVEDVGQQVFIRFYNSLDTFRHDSSVGTYLTRIAINLSLNELRRLNRFRKRFRMTDIPVEQIASEEREESLLPLVNQLSGKNRAPLVLRYLHEYSNEEAAEILGISEGSFRTRLSRALKMLRTKIEKENNDD